MKRKMFMAVYNPIEFDGRVKRTADCLSREFDLTLLCPRSSAAAYAATYRIIRVQKPSATGGVTRLLAFWWHVVANAVLLKPAIVYAHDFFLPFPGWVAARLTRSRLVYDAHELIVPEDKERLALRERIFYVLEKFVLPRADLVIAANRERAAIMKEHYRLALLPTVVRNIPPVPVCRFPDNEVLARYPLLAKAERGEVHIVYMGDMNLRRGIAVLIPALEYLPGHFKVILVGGGPDLDHFRFEAGKRGRGRIRVLGPVPHEWIHDILRQNDIGFISYPSTGLNNRYCAPNKIFEYAHAGLPVVTTSQPTIAAMLGEYKVGELVDGQGESAAREIAAAFVRIAERIGFFKQEIDKLVCSANWPGEAEVLRTAVRSCGHLPRPEPRGNE